MAPKQKQQLVIAIGLLIVAFVAVYLVFLRRGGQAGAPSMPGMPVSGTAATTGTPSGLPTTSVMPPAATAPTGWPATPVAAVASAAALPPVPRNLNLRFRDDPFKSFAPPVLVSGREGSAVVWSWGIAAVIPKPAPRPEETRFVEVGGGESAGRRVSGIVTDGRVWALLETDTDTGVTTAVVRPGDLAPAQGPGLEQPRVLSITPEGVNLRSGNRTIFVPLRSLERPITPVPMPTPGVSYPTYGTYPAPGVSPGSGTAGSYGLRGPPVDEDEPGVTPRFIK
jgi:hypothetical protein